MVKEITIEVDNTITNKTVRDYLWNYPKWITKEFREKNNIWNIFINWIVCLKCKDFIRSRNSHDFRWCKCWTVAVDWWSWMCRYIWNPEDYISITEIYEETKD